MPTLSVGTGGIQLTLAVNPEVRLTTMFDGHDGNTGSSTSLTTTSKRHVPMLLTASRASHVTLVVPTLNVFALDNREQFVSVTPTYAFHDVRNVVRAIRIIERPFPML